MDGALGGGRDGHRKRDGVPEDRRSPLALGACELFYWREGDREVDFVVRAGRRVVAIEVKSAARRGALGGLEAFTAEFRPDRKLLVGADGIPLDTFLERPAEAWL